VALPATRTAGKPSLWARFTLFLRQVVAELRKVVWPTRKELITYTWVVIVFVIFTLMVAAFDFVFD
jgi:preprotein translocase subunit SecE